MQLHDINQALEHSVRVKQNQNEASAFLRSMLPACQTRMTILYLINVALRAPEIASHCRRTAPV